jgi:predicted nucleic acid-binding Zn ribbon protein
MALLSLKEFLSSMPRRGGKYERLQIITAHWQSIVGAYLAPKSQPTGVYQEVLQVATAGSAWCQELSAQRSIILDKVNTVLRSAGIQQVYRDIHFSTSRWRSISVGNAVSPSPLKPVVIAEKPTTAVEACERFRQAIRSNHPLITCPRCGSQAFKSDVDRWGVCRFCARNRLIP